MFAHLGQLGGIALGLAVAGAVFINVALKNLQILLPDVPRSTLQLAISGTSGAYFKTLSADLQDKSTRIIVAALGQTFIFVYVGAAVALVLSVLFTVSRPLEILACFCQSTLTDLYSSAATQALQHRCHRGLIVMSHN